jgi:hypothetical protein
MYKVTTIVEGDKNRRVMIEQQVTAQNECPPWLNIWSVAIRKDGTTLLQL